MPKDKRTVAQILVLVLFISAEGCIARKNAAAPVPAPSGYQGILGNDTSRLQESLFKGDQEVLSNEDIQEF